MKDNRGNRKSSFQLPPFLKLRLNFDIEQLRKEYSEISIKKLFNGYSNEERFLLEVYGKIAGIQRRELATETYKVLSLTEFDPNYSLEMREDKSNSFWDKKIAFDKPQLDERFYRKPLFALPPYLSEVINSISPDVHRVRFAKLLPFSSITPHIDYDCRYSIRVAIPIYSPRECTNSFRLKNGTIITEHFLDDGSCYFINSGIQHWAENPSALERVFLILSIDSQKCLDL